MSSVDVIVPCYRYGHFLRACVESVLNQRISDLRILIIDDASPDNAAEVAAELMKEDHRVEFVRHSNNIGHIATYNEGIAWAEAPYMLLISADDYLAPGALERAVTLMETRKDVVLTYGSCIALRAGDPQPQFSDQLSENNWSVRPGAEFISKTCKKLKNMVPTPTAIVRTATQKKIGGYRKELTHTGDMEMWMRFAANGTVASTPAVQGVYRMHANNMSNDYYKSIIADYRQRAAALDLFFSEYELLLSDGQQLRFLAKRRLGEAAFWTAVAQCCRGNFETGFDVFRFAWDLNPESRIVPPLWHLLRVKRFDQKTLSILSDVRQKLYGRFETASKVR